MSDAQATVLPEGTGLILFVTGNAPRSRRARANLAEACGKLRLDAAAIAEIDLITEPERSMEFGVFATPALLRLESDQAVALLYGDLSASDTLTRFLSDIEDVGPAQT